MTTKVQVGQPKRINGSAGLTLQINNVFIIVWGILERLAKKLFDNYYDKTEVENKISNTYNSKIVGYKEGPPVTVQVFGFLDGHLCLFPDGEDGTELVENTIGLINNAGEFRIDIYQSDVWVPKGGF